jgi:ketosteroid isomerase-like protein
MSLALKERIYAVYEAFSAGNFDILSEMFDEQVDFESNAPAEVFPYLGRLIGRAAVLKALRSVHGEFESIVFIPLRIIIDSQSAGVIVSIQLKQRTTQRAVRLFAAHFLRFHDNRIIEYRAFLDTFEAVQQVLGRELDLNKKR